MIKRLRDLMWGLRYRYPLCCTLRYAFNRDNFLQAKQRGICTKGSKVWVPCRIFHHGEPYPYKVTVLEDGTAIIQIAGTTIPVYVHR